jgi:hypothetical protein
MYKKDIRAKKKEQRTKNKEQRARRSMPTLYKIQSVSYLPFIMSPLKHINENF